MKGAAHRLVTGILIFPIAWVGQHFTGDSTIAAAMGLGCAAGLVITPDLDQSESNSHGIKRGVWWLYGKLFCHRGISHWPVVGTLTRLLYLGWWLFPAWLLLGCPTVSPAIIKVAAFWALGLSLSDLSHTILDIKI